ncbi:MAG: DUF4175 family protein [Emcibacteraceae bacterium]|nr:DUF4175 family protein [Emcibacteraceae bacterium]
MQKNDEKFKLNKTFYAVMPAVILGLIYYSVSLFDLWEIIPGYIQLVVLFAVIIAGVVLFFLDITGKLSLSKKRMSRRLAISASLAILAVITSGDHFLRLSTLSIMPRVLFDYSDPQITATLTPPLYLNQDSQHKELKKINDNYEEINPIYEGSVLDINVQGTKWAPEMVLSDGSLVAFEKVGENEFQANVKIDMQTSWQLRQGSYVIGDWPIQLIDDESPEIDQFALEEYENDKGYLAFKVDVDDDKKIMNAEIAILKKNGVTEENTPLAISEVRSMNSIYYASLSGSSYAGKKVDVVLNVEDEAGQVTSQIIEDVLIPEKQYRHPIANKLIAIREELFKDKYERNILFRELKALGLLGEKENLPAVYYMGLRTAYWRLVNPTNDNDQEVARDLLWDLAQKLEDSEAGVIERNLLASLDELRLSIRQKKEVQEIRENLRTSDTLFKEYALASNLSTSNLYTLAIDIKALRRLYSYILSFSDQEKYYNASLIVNFMKKGIVQNDDLIFSKDGLGNYFALSESRQILDNIISIQKTLLTTSYNAQMSRRLKTPIITDIDHVGIKDKKAKQIALQKKIGNAVKILGQKISFAGSSSELLINNATVLIDEILQDMNKNDVSEVTQSQSELIAVMSNLKRMLNKPVSRSPELQNILKEINSEPVS